MQWCRRAFLPVAVGCVLVAGFFASTPGVAAQAVGTWTWPATGPLTALFDPPLSVFGSGHRGLDIAMPLGTQLVAPAPGSVSFAGTVAGARFVTIDHGDGLESTYSWLNTIIVRTGDRVSGGDPIARSGPGHPGEPIPVLHLGVRLDGEYVDPLDYLGPFSVSDFIRLAPIEGPPARPPVASDEAWDVPGPGSEPRPVSEQAWPLAPAPVVGDGWLSWLREDRPA